MSKREQILQALFEKLQTLENIPIKRNETIPQVIPETGIVMLRDGKQGEPEIILSPPMCIFKHEAEVEVIVQAVKPEDRDKKLDEILVQIGVLLSSDVTLRGLTDYVYPKPPEILEEFIEGAPTMKAAVIPIILEYSTTNVLYWLLKLNVLYKYAIKL